MLFSSDLLLSKLGLSACAIAIFSALQMVQALPTDCFPPLISLTTLHEMLCATPFSDQTYLANSVSFSPLCVNEYFWVLYLLLNVQPVEPMYSLLYLIGVLYLIVCLLFSAFVLIALRRSIRPKPGSAS